MVEVPGTTPPTGKGFNLVGDYQAYAFQMLVRYLRNLPEPEASAFRVTIVYRGSSRTLVCNVYDFVDCDSVDCALDLFDSYLQKHVNATERDAVAVENVKGGKIYLYKVDGDLLCLCVHRADVSCEDLCKGYAR